MVNFIRKYRDFILFTIGTLLIIISLFLLSYDRFVRLKSSVFDAIEMEKEAEGKDNANEFLQFINEEVNVDDVEVVDSETGNGNTGSTNYIKREYIAYLEIKKINLKSGLVSINSFYNNVDYNIQTIKESTYPDVEKGNLILAAHSGTSSISFFKNLYRLALNDEAVIYYKNNTYTYKIVKIYNVPKNGKVAINRDVDKTCLTLITCTHGSSTEQTVYILELVSSNKDGE